MLNSPSESVTIRVAVAEDGWAIADIYNHYVTKTVVTFEEEPVTAEEIARRIMGIRSAALPWLVAEEGGQLIGYTYAAPWKARAAYRYSVEITVYVAPERGRNGIGSKLYGGLFPILQNRGIHAAIGGIALPNDASIALHEKFGMRKVAQFEEVGLKFSRWIDVGYWERTL